MGLEYNKSHAVRQVGAHVRLPTAYKKTTGDLGEALIRFVEGDENEIIAALYALPHLDGSNRFWVKSHDTVFAGEGFLDPCAAINRVELIVKRDAEMRLYC